MPRLLCLALALLVLPALLAAEPKSPAGFSWNSPAKEAVLKGLPSTLRHATFTSPSLGLEVGYYIYLPPNYENSPDERYPVVYHLHGGRPGGESKSIRLASFVDQAIRAAEISPRIYVFPNGGPLSWYDHPDYLHGTGETVFVKELLPHIDATWRTQGNSAGRALEGFSQGGRGTTRIMFKYPGLWNSVAPGGSGYDPEERIHLNDGRESETLRIVPPTNNAWDLAAAYAAKPGRAPLNILFWVGTKDFNHEGNLRFMQYMDQLGIAYQSLIVPEIEHNPSRIYETSGLTLMRFHFP